MFNFLILENLLLTHPITHALLGVIAGILALQGLFYTSILTIYQLFYGYLNQTSKPIILFSLCALLSIMRISYLSQDDLLQAKNLTLQARVLTIQHQSHKKFPYTIDIEPTTDKKCQYRVFAKNALCATGDLIELEHVDLKNLVEGSMYYYLKRDRIDATIFYTKKIIPKNNFSPSSVIYSRESLYNRLKKKIPQETFSFFAPLFLGKTEDKPRNQPKLWGISHFFARSGLHLVVLLFLLELISTLLPIHYIVKRLFFLAAVLIYSYLSWTSVSFLRALFMYGICQLFTFSKKRFDLLHIWHLTTFIILFYNPFHLFCLDFQLSFFLTYILIVSHRIIRLTPRQIID